MHDSGELIKHLRINECLNEKKTSICDYICCSNPWAASLMKTDINLNRVNHLKRKQL